MSCARLVPLLGLCLAAAACEETKDPGESTPADSDPGTDQDDDSGTPDAETPPAYCAGATAHQWDPANPEDVDLFPDPLLQVDDPASPTGARLSVSVETAPWLANAPNLLADGFATLDGLSGFGPLGGIVLRFTAPVDPSSVPTTADESLESEAWILAELGEGGPVRRPYTAEVLEDGHTVLISPLLPLTLGTPHAVAVTTAAPAADGDCIAPALPTQQLLWGDEGSAAVQAAAPRHRAALAELGLDAAQVSVLSAFTVQDETATMLGLAATVREEPVEWLGSPDCELDGAFRVCELRTTVLDRRGADGLVDPSVEPVEGEIPVRIWIPAEGEGPWPTVVYGHGLSSDRAEGQRVLNELGTTGFALVAMEAVEHGDHPFSTTEGGQAGAMAFLGIDLTTVSIQPSLLRGNFDQTVLDRLRLIQLLQAHPDLDGDGVAELDPDQLGYVGVSLGAILAPAMLALEPALDGAMLTVGGGRLMNVVTDTEVLQDFEDVIAALVGSKERFDRIVPIAQHVVDPSDPAMWAAHVLDDRFDDAPAPHVVMQVGMHDEVVPRTAGFALARAFRLPHMAPVAEVVPTLEITENDPVAGNLPGGATGALFQFDRVTRDGRVQEAKHVQTPTSEEGALQMRHFAETWLDGGTPEIIDPYAVLGTPPLD